MKRLIISFVTVVIVASGTVFVSAYVMRSPRPVSESYENRLTAVNVKAPITQLLPAFTERDLVTLTDCYIALIKQEIDDDYCLVDVTTTAELYQGFDKIATRDVSEAHVSYYFTEKEDGVYLRPTALPPWFEKDTPYRLTQVSDEEVIVEQTIEDLELYGPYQIRFWFSYTDQWRISQVDTISLEPN
ncbi:hypothetical protein SAMN05421839_1547 [Halolactibacillus halophilus]|uniref:Uncharacterized protein n=1 Tax=Halolactibacillus halophilus TaxID=306540 RepID=A0A1I5SXK4_9BACI|nr:hypothetical protein [Halolactibacillus halophilus]GEM02792.1 hypothetical protein HHA03_23240 [Halolactibacillus halophilus]SFP75469.1 hypothetical protein SAMN05421839_1547 [Halolactibacillus halophilus]